MVAEMPLSGSVVGSVSVSEMPAAPPASPSNSLTTTHPDDCAGYAVNRRYGDHLTCAGRHGLRPCGGAPGGDGDGSRAGDAM